jgi:DNA polymerase elongation subunit (family B)
MEELCVISRWVRLRDGGVGVEVKTSRGRWVTLEGFPPYFFVDRRENGGSSEGVYIDGREMSKVCTEVPSEVPPLRAKYKLTGEADLPYYRRFLIDRQLTFCAEPRFAFYDIEADATQGFPDPSNPTGAVISYAIADDRGREDFFCSSDEREVFGRFQEEMCRYDFLVGFKSGYRVGKGGEQNGWDLPYLVARAKKIGVKFDHRITSWGDFAVMYRKANLGDPGSLDYLCETVLGQPLNKPAMRAAEISRWFREDRNRLRDYNLADAVALKELERELDLVKTFIEVSNIAGVSYSDSHSMYIIVDTLVLRECQRREPRLVMPTASEEAEPEQKAGGYVSVPRVGLHRNVWVYDFRQLYPSIIVTFNMGLETVGGEIRSEVLSFATEPKSVFASVLERLMRLRRRAKEMGLRTRQMALKVCSNSFYGACGFIGSRYYHKGLAESITKTGQAIIKTVMDMFSDFFYGDTDSCHLSHEIDLEDFNAELRRRLEARYGQLPNYCIELALEGNYLGAFYPAEGQKKRYVLFPEEGEPIIKGFEAVRRNAPKLFKRVQREVFGLMHRLLREGREGEVSAEVWRYRDELVRRIRSGELDSELVIRSGLRDPEEYRSQNCPTAKVAREIQRMGYSFAGTADYVIADIGPSGHVVKPVLEGERVEVSPRAREHYISLLDQMLERLVPRGVQTDLSRWI